MKTSRRNIMIFIVVVLLCGWFGVLVDKLIPEQPQGDTLGMGIWLISPLLATILLRSFAGDGWRDIGLLPNFKGNLKWYVIALFIYPAVTTLVLLISYVFNWMDFSAFNLSTVLSVFLSGLLIQFVKNFFEESVWRGYLTSKLSNLKLNDFWLYLIVGGVWGAWHIPYFLVFLSESDIISVLPVNRWLFTIIGIVTMICWTVMYTEIYLMTRSIWPLVLMHMTEDALVNPLILDGYIKLAQGKEFLVSPSAGILTTCLYLVVGWLLRVKRKKMRSGYGAQSVNF
ncbi:CPBP family intramembrane glutamic endopeptidase [Lysinibacillus pakistanensis]|uniref:CPBP family intramembrane metalloprotease n=1 Tax=Lysinibacillus pakistanensis TaxID=759811 RepID=A0AAX3WRW6_9BACI|nr:CPBP family intramembrane glutamic endopeptidase [Lysinibacillus pakistanensis]MDM5229918.1 CPBP family intramembrane metalloprotease [Lysinibacillus pakistanensis]WHY45518.1 CPBP family intramembrane metalloprotease [Lysinibacillus pakistanensis]WHY50526.1 CPBP family intramembrane metalloprotease [Lysinibacillus pakistanensis]